MPTVVRNAKINFRGSELDQLSEQKLYFATGNAGKLKELVEISQKFFPFFKNPVGRAPKNVDENRETFLGNSALKAEALARELIAEGEKNFCVIADDSGLEVEALNGAPGVSSARYAGKNATSTENIEKLKKALTPFRRLDDREARYVCALTFLIVVNGVQKALQAEGYFEGYIGFEEKGESGFGYDPLFLLLDKKTSLAEVDPAEKNELSHRWEAFEELKELLVGGESRVDEF